jgi:hypothetical protein
VDSRSDNGYFFSTSSSRNENDDTFYSRLAALGPHHSLASRPSLAFVAGLNPAVASEQRSHCHSRGRVRGREGGVPSRAAGPELLMRPSLRVDEPRWFSAFALPPRTTTGTVATERGQNGERDVHGRGGRSYPDHAATRISERSKIEAICGRSESVPAPSPGSRTPRPPTG